MGQDHDRVMCPAAHGFELVFLQRASRKEAVAEANDVRGRQILLAVHDEFIIVGRAEARLLGEPGVRKARLRLLLFLAFVFN
jgi:hypothetical protein